MGRGQTGRRRSGRREAATQPDPNKPKMGYLMEADGKSCRVLPSSMVEVAELIECPVEDLTFLRYGALGQMVMSRSRQLDRMLAPNRSASIVVAKLHQLPIYPRGSVVCFPHGFTWDTQDARADA